MGEIAPDSLIWLVIVLMIWAGVVVGGNALYKALTWRDAGEHPGDE